MYVWVLGLNLGLLQDQGTARAVNHLAISPAPVPIYVSLSEGQPPVATTSCLKPARTNTIGCHEEGFNPKPRVLRTYALYFYHLNLII